MMRTSLLTVAAAASLSAGCGDAGTDSVHQFGAADGPAFSATSRALDPLGPGWRTTAESPHGCFVSVAARDGAIPYLYRRIPLRLPTGVQTKDGAVTAFRYRGVRPDGRVLAVLNCVIPATDRAREAVARRFGVPDGPEKDGVVIQGCVTENSRENPCPIDPIVVIAPPAEEPCSNCNEPVPPPPPSGGGGGTGPCSSCGPAAPTLSCTSGVPRGGTGQCTVSTGDGSIPEVVGWEFTDGVSTVTQYTSAARWRGTAVQSGTVTAALADGNRLQANFGVADRGWKWATHATSEYGDGTATCLNHTPSFGPGNANGLNLPMDNGASDCTTGQRMIQPDSYAPAGDGFTVGTVSGGPNEGLHYVKTARLYLRRKSAYNQGMWPSAAGVALRDEQQSACGDWTNWHGFMRCMGADPDGYIAGVRAHEGYGTTGHNGHFSAAYDAVADPSNDPMIFFDQRVGPNTLDLGAFVTNTRNGFYPRAQRSDIATRDISGGGTVVTGNWSGTYYGWSPPEGKFLVNHNSF